MFVPRVGVGVNVIVGHDVVVPNRGVPRGRGGRVVVVLRVHRQSQEREEREARSSTPSSRVLLAPSSGSMTKPPNTKWPLGVQHPPCGRSGARERELLSVRGRPAGSDIVDATVFRLS